MSSSIPPNYAVVHNQAPEVSDERFGTQNNNASMAADPGEPAEQSSASLWPSSDQLSYALGSVDMQKAGDQPHESQTDSSPAGFMKLPAEMKEEIADNLPRKDLENLSLMNKSLNSQFHDTVAGSLNKSKLIHEAARDMGRMNKKSPEFSSKFTVQMQTLSSHRPADQPQDLKNFVRQCGFSFPPEENGQMLSELLKYPIDQESLDTIDELSYSPPPVDKSSGIVNDLLDQIEKQSAQGTLPAEDYLSSPLETAARMVKYMPPEDKRSAAERIRAMATLQNLEESDLPMIMINHHLNGEDG